MHGKDLRYHQDCLRAADFTLLRQQATFHAFSCSSKQALTWTWVTKMVSIICTMYPLSI